MGKSNKRPVSDFLLSVDYGICHGRIDSINQIWVKDKPILCGQYTENSIETVYIPDRFGGDDAEGGVAGVVEMYMGTDDQVSSEALASRFGATSATWPGYVGVSHIFFRGATSGNADVLTPGGPDALDGTLFSRDNGAGFVWGSNNPYFPEVKVHCTRFSNTLAVSLPAIPATTGVIIAGNSASFSNTPNGYVMLGSGAILYEYFPTDPDDFNNSSYFQTAMNGGDPFAPFSQNSFNNMASYSQTNGGVHTPTTSWGGTTGTVSKPSDPATLFAPNINFIGNSGAALNGADQSGVRSELDSTASEAEQVYSVVDFDLLTFEGSGAMPTGSTLFYTKTLAQHIADGTCALTFAAEIRAYGGTNVAGTGYGRIQIYSGLTQGAETSLLFDWSETVAVGVGRKRYVSLQLPVDHRYVRVVYQSLANGFSNASTGYFIGYSSAKIGELSFPTVNVGTNRVSSGASNFFGLATPYEYTAPVYAYCQPNGDLTGFPDDNPASMIYEILTNAEWGKGEDPANIDTASFVSAGNTLITERMGMSMVWVKQDVIENVIQDILDHIKAFLFINPMTGLYQLRLLRYDYDPNTAPVLNETNCKATKRKRRAWGETINEIVVSYTDPNNEEAATVPAQDDANISTQGSIVSETREYSGFRNAFIAQFVADRDVREAAYPLFSCTAEVNRTFWNTLPGDVFKLSWAKDGISSMLVRVMGVKYGKPKSKTMQLALVEDIFALDQTTYGDVPASIWTPDQTDPIPFDYEVIPDIPMPLLQRNGFLPADIDANYPSQGVLALGAHSSIDAVDFQLHTLMPDPLGGSSVQSVMTSFPTKVAQTTVDLLAEAESRIPVVTIDYLFQGMARPGDVLFLGQDEYNHELLMLDFYDSGTQEWNVIRGLWDTTPYDWYWPEALWRFPMDGTNFDPNIRTSGENRDYRMLPRTSFGRLPYSSAFDRSITVGERAHRPFRPANCQLDGRGFGTLLLADVVTPGQMTAAWANRNRTLEDSVIRRWTDGNVTPEAGQTTTIIVYNTSWTPLVTYTGLTGTSQIIPFSSLGGTTTGWVEFKSVNAIGDSLYNSFRYFDIS